MSAQVACTARGEELGDRAGERAELEGRRVLRVKGYDAGRKSWCCQVLSWSQFTSPTWCVPFCSQAQPRLFVPQVGLALRMEQQKSSEAVADRLKVCKQQKKVKAS